MFWILGWLFYGLVVGLIAKAIHPGDEPAGLLPTIGIGIAGSFLGGVLNWMLGFGGSPFAFSGWIMGIIGGVIFCFIYMKFLKQHIEK